VIDKSYAVGLSSGTDYTLGVNVRGGVVNVSLNGAVVVSNVYSETVTTFGGYGTLALSGTTSFDSVRLRTDDAVYAGTVWQFADGPAPTNAVGVPLTDAELAPVVAEAKQLWTQALGAGDPHVAALDGVTVQVADLQTLALGVTMGESILIDNTAAGWGWSISSASPAPGQMDLLSTVLHEMGNAMGFAENLGQGVMGLVLDPGVRTLPGAENPAQATAAPRAETPSLLAALDDSSPLYVSADRSINWGEAGTDVVKLKKGDTPVTAQPAWAGDFVNHLARTNSERNPNLGIRVQVDVASKVSSTLRRG